MSESTLATMTSWLAEPMGADVRSLIERLRSVEDVQRIAVMPDVHLASDVCVGVVLATSRLLFPAAVGGDIGCGMLSLAFEAGADVLEYPAIAGRILNGLRKAVPPMRRHRARAIPYPRSAIELQLSHSSLEAFKRGDAALQLGTLGGGNHFVELQADETDRLWLMIHTGSRAIGQIVRAHHLARAQRVGGGMLALDAANLDGQAYLNDMEWCRQYAAANRRAIAECVVELLREVIGIRPTGHSAIECDHNHLATEVHDGRSLQVHRKGAMHVPAGTIGVLPGSMGTLSYHVEGRGCVAAMYSSAHGAGRALSRHAANTRFSSRELQRQMQGVWFDHRLADRLRDESPRAYKDVRAVLRAQHELVRVTRTLKPLLVYKGG